MRDGLDIQSLSVMEAECLYDSNDATTHHLTVSPGNPHCPRDRIYTPDLEAGYRIIYSGPRDRIFTSLSCLWQLTHTIIYQLISTLSNVMMASSSPPTLFSSFTVPFPPVSVELPPQQPEGELPEVMDINAPTSTTATATITTTEGTGTGTGIEAGGGTGGAGGVPKRTISLEAFHIIKVIGKGSFGKVFLARDKARGTLHALKVLKKVCIIIHIISLILSITVTVAVTVIVSL